MNVQVQVQPSRRATMGPVGPPGYYWALLGPGPGPIYLLGPVGAIHLLGPVGPSRGFIWALLGPFICWALLGPGPFICWALLGPFICWALLGPFIFQKTHFSEKA